MGRPLLRSRNHGGLLLVLEELLHCKTSRHTKVSRELNVDHGLVELRQMSPPINNGMSGYDVSTHGRSQLECLLKPETSSMRSRRPSGCSSASSSPQRRFFSSTTSSVSSNELVSDAGTVIHLKQEFSADEQLNSSSVSSLSTPIRSPEEEAAEARADQALLMSGISQLASEIVEAQEAQAKSRFSQMVTDVANNFVAMPEHQRASHDLVDCGYMSASTTTTAGCSPTSSSSASSMTESTVQPLPDATSAFHHSDSMPLTGEYGAAPGVVEQHIVTHPTSPVPNLSLTQLLPIDVACLDHQSAAGTTAMNVFMGNCSPVVLTEQQQCPEPLSSVDCTDRMFGGSGEVVGAELHGGQNSGLVQDNIANALGQLKSESCTLHTDTNAHYHLAPNSSSSISTTSTDGEQIASVSVVGCSTPDFPGASGSAPYVAAQTSAVPSLVDILASPQVICESASSAAPSSSAPTIATSNSTVNDASPVDSLVKSEAIVRPQVATGQYASGAAVVSNGGGGGGGGGGNGLPPTDLSYFQQSMTMTLSQMSDADLLSIINPSTFLSM